MLQKIPISTYLVANARPAMQRLVVQFGLPPAKSDSDLIRKLKYIVQKHTKKAWAEIAKVHPDAELFSMNFDGADNKEDALPKIDKSQIMSEAESTYSEFFGSNACGCSGADGENEPPDIGLVLVQVGLVGLIGLITIELFAGNKL